MSNPTDPDRWAPPRRATEVAPDIYAYVQPDGSWWINNTGFLVGRRGVVSIDACSTRARTEAYLETIAGLTSAPVRTLVNTHHHGDHTFGNYLFPGATIVGREGLREAAFAFGPPPEGTAWTPVDWGDIELEPPFLTFRDAVTLHVDDLVCHVRAAGPPAHTTNDAIVWIPEHRLVFAGDLVFNGGTPFLLQGSLAGALRSVAMLRDLAPETIVPGHGPVCGIEVLDTIEGYLTFLQDVARRGHEAGVSPLEAARETDLGPYAQLLDAERIVGNLHRAYAELDGAEPGVPLDIVAALVDMMTYNGGTPLTCHA